MAPKLSAYGLEVIVLDEGNKLSYPKLKQGFVKPLFWQDGISVNGCWEDSY
jgi:hypothetical protein